MQVSTSTKHLVYLFEQILPVVNRIGCWPCPLPAALFVKSWFLLYTHSSTFGTERTIPSLCASLCISSNLTLESPMNSWTSMTSSSERKSSKTSGAWAAWLFKTALTTQQLTESSLEIRVSKQNLFKRSCFPLGLFDLIMYKYVSQERAFILG